MRTHCSDVGQRCFDTETRVFHDVDLTPGSVLWISATFGATFELTSVVLYPSP